MQVKYSSNAGLNAGGVFALPFSSWHSTLSVDLPLNQPFDLIFNLPFNLGVSAAAQTYSLKAACFSSSRDFLP